MRSPFRAGEAPVGGGLHSPLRSEGLGSPSRQQKWLEQLCQVESQLLAYWQEFADHRQDVQVQLQALTDDSRRTAASRDEGISAQMQREARLEAELQQCRRQLQQIVHSQEELNDRFVKLRGGLEENREVSDRLRSRLDERLAEEIAAAVDGQRNEFLASLDANLRESSEAARRAVRLNGDELLQKIQELGEKVAEDVNGLQDRTSTATQRLHQAVDSLAERLESAAAAAGADIRELEERNEVAVRARLGEFQLRLDTLTEETARLSGRSEAEGQRVAKLESRLRDCAESMEGLLTQGERRTDALEAALADASSSCTEQVSRLREEFALLLHEQQRESRELSETFSASLQERSRLLREELQEVLRTQEADLKALRLDAEALERKTQARFEQDGLASAKAFETLRETAQQANSTLREEIADAAAKVRSEAQKQLDGARVEFATARGEQQAKLGEHADLLAQVRRSIGEGDKSLAEQRQRVDAHEKLVLQRLDAHEKALRKAADDLRLWEERTSAQNVTNAEQLALARAEAQEAIRGSEHLGRVAERLREAQTTGLEAARSELRQEMLQRADAFRATDCERIDALRDEMRRLHEELRAEARARSDEAAHHLEPPLAALRERVDTLTAVGQEGAQALEALRLEESRRFEAVERAHAEAGAHVRERFRELQQQMQARHGEAVRLAGEEYKGRAAKSYAELAERIAELRGELRAELAREVEGARRAAQQGLDETAAQLKADQSLLAQLRSGSVAREHLDGCVAELREWIARAQASSDASHAEQRAAIDGFGRDIRQLREGLLAAQEGLAGAWNEAKDREGHLLDRLGELGKDHGSRLASSDREHGETRRMLGELEERHKHEREQLNQRVAELKVALKDARAQATEDLKQHAAAGASELNDTRKALTEQHRELVLDTKRALTEQHKDAQSKSEERFASLVRELSQAHELTKNHGERLAAQLRQLEHNLSGSSQDVTAARGHGERLEAQLKHLEETVAKRHQEHRSSVGELHAKHAAQVAQHVAEAHDSLSEQLRLLREAAAEQVQQAAVRHGARLEDLQRETQATARSYEASVAEAARAAELQQQELRGMLQEGLKALHARCAEGESRGEQLRHELHEKIGQHAAKHREEHASHAAKLIAAEKLLSQEIDRLEALSATHAQQAESRLEVAVERLAGQLSECEQQVKRNVVALQASAAESSERQKGAEAEQRTRQEATASKVAALQEQLAELKASVAAAATSAQLREEQVVQEFDRRGRIAQEALEKAEAKTMEVAKAAAKAREALEQRLSCEVSAAMAVLATKEQLSEVKESQRAIAKVGDDGRQGAEAVAKEIQQRLEKIEERFAEHVRLQVEDADRRCKRHHEANEALQRQHLEHAEVFRKRCADLQQGIDSTNQRHVEGLAQAKNASQDVHQKGQRESAAALAELKAKVDEVSDRLASEFRTSLVALQGRLQEVHSEHQQQLAADRAAAQALVSDCGRQQDEKLREASAAAARERARIELQAQRQLEEGLRLLRQELADCSQRAEAAAAAAQERAGDQAQLLFKEARQSAAAALQDLSESTERKLRDTADTASRLTSDQGQQQHAMSKELKALVQARCQALEDDVGELQSNLAATDGDLRRLSEELPVIAKRFAAAQQTQTTALEDFKRAAHERHAQLQRKVQVDADAFQAHVQQAASQLEDVRGKLKELDQSLNAGIEVTRREAHEEIEAVRKEGSAAHRASQAALAELAQSHRLQKEQQSAALAELTRRHEEWLARLQRRSDELEALTAQARILAVCGEAMEGLVRTVTSQELQVFQREALDSLEWKLERCVQWLHGANVKLGLNPQGTMFSTDRFREMLFDASASLPAKAAGAPTNGQRSSRRAQSAAGRAGRAPGQ
eukprot:TRINITY_DN13760_c1_g3_i2.p1 TRINITY_DN13760_c1_g3~~TRINITY_DN13760_c1_g3_i2.p1  ORF type:complete len:1944 (+),score=586.34 TRINITY_DN13760_c1_g3_i2:202-5832(+)